MLLVSSLIDQCILTLSPFIFLKETSDYNRTEITVEFQPGNVTQTVNVPIVDDMVLEGLESFSATLIPNQPNVVVPDESSNADITIIDDDASTISFSTDDVRVDEGNLTARVCLMLSAPLSTSLDVIVTLTPGSG